MAFTKFINQVLSLAEINSPAALLRVINTLQTNVGNSINTILAKPQVDSSVLTSVTLVPGQNNVINHKLNRTLLGWKIVRVRNQAQISDTQDANPQPNLTLWLSTSALVIVDIEVF